MDTLRGDAATPFSDKVSGRGIQRVHLVDRFRVGSTWLEVDFTMCCRSLFVVERITVTDLLTNKISGSGSCLSEKL